MVSFVKSFSWLFCLLFLAMLATPGPALRIQAPATFTVSGSQGTLEATIVNDSASELPLQVSVFAPSRFQIQAPATIAANHSAAIKIVFDNYPFLYNTTYETQLQAMLGGETAARKIVVSFQEPTVQPNPQPEPSPTPGPDLAKEISTGFAALFGTINFELALQILLVIVIVILCVALIARVYNRAKEGKK
jgi:hypothetical protein